MINYIKGKVFTLGSELVYRLAILKHAPNLPTLEEGDRKILDTLKHDGVHITNLAELGFDSTPELLKAAYICLSQMEPINNNDANESSLEHPEVCTQYRDHTFPRPKLSESVN